MLRLLQTATAVTALGLGLAGCTPPAESMLEDYLDRVGNVLDAEAPTISEPVMPSYPRPRQVRQTPPEIRIDLLDAWSLRQCEVFVLLGERNSILGKVAEPIVRLDYERRLLKLLPRCLNADIDLPDSLRASLERALSEKRRAFALHLWNATLANPDYQAYWTGGERPFSVTDDIDANGYGAAQHRLATLVADPLQGDLQAWSDTLQLTTQYPMGGHSVQSMRAAMGYLEQTETLLNQAADERRLCPAGAPMKELDYARNVMTDIFIERVQPWLVSVDQRFLAGYDALVAMHRELPIDNGAMTDYIADLSAWHRAYRDRIKRQVEAWQRLFESCGRRATR